MKALSAKLANGYDKKGLKSPSLQKSLQACLMTPFWLWLGKNRQCLSRQIKISARGDATESLSGGRVECRSL